MGGSLYVIACSDQAFVPHFGGRRARGQHQDALIDIDDYATDSDEVKQPLFL